MDSDDMASDSSKGFIIVECQKPANGTLKHVCVPKSWIICPITDKTVCIVYPNEDKTRTVQRLMKNEPPGQGWRSYIGEIIHETESARDALFAYVGIDGTGNIKKHDEEGSKSHIAPQASIISPELANSEAPPAADTECVASRSAAVAASPPVEVTPDNTSVTVARDSLKVKIRREDYGRKSEKSENMKKSTKKISKGNKFKVKFQFKDKSNKFKAKHMKKRASKENFRNLNVNTENTFLGNINTSGTTEVDQNKPGFEHIMTKRMELKIKDIRYSSEPELKRLALNKTNSVVSKANLSENVQKNVHITLRNLSPSDKKLLVNLHNEQNESLEKIRNLDLQLKGLFMEVNEDKETLNQLFLKYKDGPLEAVPLERRNDEDCNINDDERDAKEDHEEDEEEVPLIYEEEEEKASEREEMESVSDVDSKQSFSPPSSPELLKKNVRKNNRWTLRYKQPGEGLIQLGNSRVYLSALGLERCKRTCRDIKTFVRELYTEVFTYEALSTCSMTGRNPFVGRKGCSPALHFEAQSVTIKYALNYSQKVGWDHVNRHSLLQTIRNMLLRFRNKRNGLLAKKS